MLPARNLDFALAGEPSPFRCSFSSSAGGWTEGVLRYPIADSRHTAIKLARDFAERRALSVELSQAVLGDRAAPTMTLLIHRLQAVLFQVVADRRRASTHPLANLLQGQAFGQVSL